MRDIRFRAWDNTFNVMLNDVVVWDSNNECIAILDQPAEWAYGDKLDERMDLNFEGSVPEWYCFTGGFNIMQYTGLKDKNCVEIYEGDILHTVAEAKYGYPKPGKDLYKTVRFGRHFAKDDTLYEYQAFYCESNSGAQGSISYFLSHGATVIGNIYQNPELLK